MTTPAASAILRRLADRRHLDPPSHLDADAAHWLYQWYRAGYIQICGQQPERLTPRRN